MRAELQPYYHKILAGVIDEVLRCHSGPIRVPELAVSAGFSRFHLARLFHETTEETLEQFLRRIRLERAAHTLISTDQSVLGISIDGGYRSPEAFSRAFRQAFGQLPSIHRRESKQWMLPSPSDLHWNADWVESERPSMDLEERVVELPARYACVWRAVGSYSKLAESWERLEIAYSGQIPENATFITIYLDNMWTHPVSSTMRAEIGWLCSPSDHPPLGMRRIVIPAGRYAITRFVARTERNDAWSYFSGKYTRRSAGQVYYDEYGGWPLPFARVTTKLMVGLAERIKT
jgi:AraC family transcriptional regulator